MAMPDTTSRAGSLFPELSQGVLVLLLRFLFSILRGLLGLGLHRLRLVGVGGLLSLLMKFFGLLAPLLLSFLGKLPCLLVGLLRLLARQGVVDCAFTSVEFPADVCEHASSALISI